MIKETKEDLRIRRSRQSIKNAFFTLLGTTSFEKITIRKIAEKAMISQPTFYYHYCDKYDLAQTLMQECLEEFRTGVREYINTMHDASTRSRFWDEMFRSRETLSRQMVLLSRIYLENFDFKEEQQKTVYDATQWLLPRRNLSPVEYEHRCHIMTSLILEYLTGSYWQDYTLTFETFLSAVSNGVSDYLSQLE